MSAISRWVAIIVGALFASGIAWVVASFFSRTGMLGAFGANAGPLLILSIWLVVFAMVSLSMWPWTTRNAE